jgi:hypothetical protein
MGEAVARAWRKSCNPGGEVAGFPFAGKPEMPAGRLFSLAEIEAMGVQVVRPFQKEGA